MVRYIDSGFRDAQHAVGTWLEEVLLAADDVSEIRVQTGFFGAGTLGYFEPALARMQEHDAPVRFLIGSNDGVTARTALDDLLAIAGPPRPNLKLAVVSFQNGFFHPKVFHFRRADGSTAAYVGSANLTSSGVRAQHVEAGIILDSGDGDPHSVLVEIQDAIDAWFAESRAGFYPILNVTDLDVLTASGVIGVAPPPKAEKPNVNPAGGGTLAKKPTVLYPLIAMPKVDVQRPAPSAPEPDSTPLGGAAAGSGSASGPSTAASSIAHWSKKLSRSDAQRKQSGNQSGAVALTQGDYVHRIDQTTYFRHDLFRDEDWVASTAITGQSKDVAEVPMSVEVDGVDHGVLVFRVSNASNRESGQRNYTAQLHLEPISQLFRQHDMTGKRLEIEHFDDGSYTLTIG